MDESKYDKPNWYPDADVIATKEGWVYTPNHNEVLSAIGNLDDKLVIELAEQFVNTVAPVLSGTIVSGSVLSVTTGTWAASATYAYRWEQSTNGTTWTTISGATANNYTLVAGNVGKTVRAVVIATGSGTTKEANSNVIGPITAT